MNIAAPKNTVNTSNVGALTQRFIDVLEKTGLPPEKVLEFAGALKMDLLHLGQKSVGEAMLEAVAVVQARRSQVDASGVNVIDTLKAQTASAVEANTAQVVADAARLEKMVAGLPGLRTSEAVKALAGFVAAKLNPNLAKDATVLNVIPILSYTKPGDPQASHPSDRNEKTVQVVMTHNGLRVDQGGFGQTDTPNAAEMAKFGVSLEQLTAKVNEAMTLAVAGKASTLSVKASEHDLLHTEGFTPNLDVKAFLANLEPLFEGLPQKGGLIPGAADRAAALKQAVASLPKTVSAAEYLEATSGILKSLAAATGQFTVVHGMIDSSGRSTDTAKVSQPPISTTDLVALAKQIVDGAARFTLGPTGGYDLAYALRTMKQAMDTSNSNIVVEPNGQEARPAGTNLGTWNALADRVFPPARRF